MTNVICYALGPDNPFEKETHVVNANGNEVAKCKPDHGIIGKENNEFTITF